MADSTACLIQPIGRSTMRGRCAASSSSWPNLQMHRMKTLDNGVTVGASRTVVDVCFADANPGVRLAVLPTTAMRDPARNLKEECVLPDKSIRASLRCPSSRRLRFSQLILQLVPMRQVDLECGNQVGSRIMVLQL